MALFANRSKQGKAAHSGTGRKNNRTNEAGTDTGRFLRQVEKSLNRRKKLPFKGYRKNFFDSSDYDTFQLWWDHWWKGFHFEVVALPRENAMTIELHCENTAEEKNEILFEYLKKKRGYLGLLLDEDVYFTRKHYPYQDGHYMGRCLKMTFEKYGHLNRMFLSRVVKRIETIISKLTPIIDGFMDTHDALAICEREKGTGL